MCISITLHTSQEGQVMNKNNSRALTIIMVSLLIASAASLFVALPPVHAATISIIVVGSDGQSHTISDIIRFDTDHWLGRIQKPRRNTLRGQLPRRIPSDTLQLNRYYSHKQPKCYRIHQRRQWNQHYFQL